MDDALTKAIAALTAAAERLGFEAIRIWPQVVGITFVRALFWTVVSLTLLALLIVALVRLWQHAKHRFEATKNDDEWSSAIIISTVLLAFVIFILFQLPDQLAAVFYPEAATVLRLMGK